MAVPMMVHIQQKYDLYSTSTTMTLIVCLVGVVMVAVIALLDRRWYLVAWAVTLIAPPVLFFFVLRFLERHPPVPPLG